MGSTKVTKMRTGAEILVDQLLAHQVERVFTVPGESFLDVLNALHDHTDSVRVTTCRVETGASNMAEAYGKATGKPGICMVTRGPGATHASIGVHTAAHDGTPMLLFIGQVARRMRGRGAFQEVDYNQMFGGMAKWTVELDDPSRIPEQIARAFSVATSGTPGPVIISMPEDVLSGKADVPDAVRYSHVQPSAGREEVLRFGELLTYAKRPLMVVGCGSWAADDCMALAQFARTFKVPVAAAFRSQDAFDNDDDLYVGDLGLGQNPKLSQRLRESDLVIALGTQLEENVTKGYTLIGIPTAEMKLVHIHPNIVELGRVYQPDLAINSSPRAFLRLAVETLDEITGDWKDWANHARIEYEAFQSTPKSIGQVNMATVMKTMRDMLPDNAVIANGAGNYTVWLHRFFRYRQPKTQIAPTSGAMGYSVPAAIGAKLAHPGRHVVSLNGDGCFMMCSQELATAVHVGANVVFIVVNNGMLGTIRMHQERHFPGRVIATDLVNPDFVTFAKSFGVAGERIDKTELFEAAFRRALDAEAPYLLEIAIDPEALTPLQSLTEIRDAGFAAARN
ncbi:thiamine pyrophosphate-binding protein [Aminobacter sp. Y103A]|uniref:thiamine pyrophosphate-binding protein n=1 Tax=Aminobacter sp. Y103A TaxID=1870862 RepID=UPI002573B811|nr:thiamine pyrophosphate-binding protein [Aminobacter sp. SS-2016]BBD39646.1 thiamine pyrophosphate-binding protein [Aminobacter sp. SS-2016]